MEREQSLACVRFGNFELQPGERRLLVDGRPVPVGPRAFDLLTLLVERAGMLVTKNEILERVWPKLVVEENNLQVQISALRKVLGADSIATVPGHGYRLTLAPLVEANLPAVDRNHNLPLQLSTFVGRQRELAHLKGLLDKAQLLTLVGFGGIGKTRLSLQAVAHALHDYPDGVWFVDLAPLTDARLVPQAVASVLEVQEPGRGSVLEALLRHVEGRQLLLVLDSCEHLVAECADLAKRLLQSGRRLKILATSRERLNIAAEVTYVVPALTMPDADPAITLAALSQYEAVHLFIERARLAYPAFQLTHQNATAVAAICRRVDGIPLAIELAAARVRVLSVEAIAERLHDRFRLLTRGDSTALPHRQTLRAMIDWSYELLTEPGRSLLRRFAVFPGTFTLAAAEAVGTGDDIAEADVLDVLTELVEKSMVVVESGGERYRLLDTVRQYAHERLLESADEAPARRRHLDFYVAFAADVHKQSHSSSVRSCLERLDLEWENLLSTHEMCGRVDGGATQGLVLVYSLGEYFLHRGMFEHGYRLTLEALRRPGADAPSRTRVGALDAAGLISQMWGRNEQAEAHLREAVAIARELDHARGLAVSLRLLGVVAYSQGNYGDARRYLEEALVVVAEGEEGVEVHRGAVSAALAEVHRLEGDLAAAEPLLEEMLALARKRDLRVDCAAGLLNLAAVLICRGSTARVPPMLIELLALAQETGSKLVVQGLVEVAAGLAATLGEWRRAAQLFGVADAQLEAMGTPREAVDEAYIGPLIARTREALGEATFAAAEAAGRTLSDEAALAEVRAWLTPRT